MIKNCREFGTTVALSRGGHPPKVNDWVRKVLLKDAIKRPSRVTRKESEKSTPQMEGTVHRTTIA